jgi:acetylornithine deacetylase/succinyl-diaminopimelate desuccinylase-like protein
MAEDLATLRAWLKRRVTAPEFREFLAESLLEMCRIDTIPTRDLADTAAREGRLLRLLEETVGRYGLAGRLERSPIAHSIAGHPFYTFPHYAGTEDAYFGRGNLLYLWDAPAACGAGPGAAKGGLDCRGLAVNAHIDTVAPYFPPRREGQRVIGRGACDDKGGCAVMVASLRLLSEIEERFAVCPASDLTFMFVIEEEMGGNGSLALAMDERLGERCGTVVVLECCDGQVHPGGRGALWYLVEIPTFNEESTGSPSGCNPLLLALEIIRSMDREGAAIRAESDHPLFVQTAVQTSPGILGTYGEHPSRICASVAFELGTEEAEPRLDELDSLLNRGLREYIRRYGDKSAEGQSGSGTEDRAAPRLQRHCDLQTNEAGNVELHVYGLSGHMGALYENDNALIKAAYLLEPVRFASGPGGEGWRIGLLDQPPRRPLILEGGQGFVPTHSMDQIRSRLSSAVKRAYRRYTGSACKGVPSFREAPPRLSFAKLHNEAFQSDPSAPAVADAILAAEDAGIDVRRPVPGWEVSSDARIFAHLCPGVSVFTTGPGKLALAHSDREQITIDELCAGALMLTLYVLRRGGLAARDGRAGPAASRSSYS